MESSPEEIIEKILDFLPIADLKNVSLVSKRYNFIIGNSLKLMRKFTLNLGKEYDFGIPRCLSVSDTKILSESSRKYQEIMLFQGQAGSFEDNLKVVMNVTRCAQSMKFEQCEYIHSDWTSFLNAVKSVEDLTFFQCTMPIGPNEETTKITFDDLKVLRILLTTPFGFVSDIYLGIQQIMSHKNLQELELQANDYAIDLWEFLDWTPHLTTLNFEFVETDTIVTEENLIVLQPFIQRPGKIYNPPNIQHLKLSNIFHPNMQQFRDFIKSFSTSLISLNLEGCAITIASFIDLLGSLNLLEKMALIIDDDKYCKVPVHQKIKEIDVFFTIQNADSMKLVLSALPNLEILKSNVPAEIITELVKDGMLLKLKKSTQYKREVSETGSDDYDYYDRDYWDFDYPGDM